MAEQPIYWNLEINAEPSVEDLEKISRLVLLGIVQGKLTAREDTDTTLDNQRI